MLRLFRLVDCRRGQPFRFGPNWVIAGRCRTLTDGAGCISTRASILKKSGLQHDCSSPRNGLADFGPEPLWAFGASPCFARFLVCQRSGTHLCRRRVAGVPAMMAGSRFRALPQAGNAFCFTALPLRFAYVSPAAHVPSCPKT